MTRNGILIRLVLAGLTTAALAAGPAHAASIQDGTSNIGNQSTGSGAATASMDRKSGGGGVAGHMY
jgi:hypothetical protein